MLESLWDIIFPPECLICRGDVLRHTTLCENCFLEINLNKTFFCGKCRARLAENKKICHLDFPYLLGAAGNYSDKTLETLIKALKFKSVKWAANSLGEILFEYSKQINFPWKNFSVIPLPISRKRARRRGFNQAELIARRFADLASLNVKTGALTRHKHSPPQSDLKSWESREENVKNCFSVIDEAALRGKNIILVDDVVTSGATLFSAAEVLKNAGVKRLLALVVAKA